MKQLTLLLFLIQLGFQNCRKEAKTEPEQDPAPTEEVKGKLLVEMDNKVEDEVLVFNKYYLDARGDSFLVKKLNYFISNIVLTREDNSTFSVPESYFIIRHPDSRSFTLNNIPPGNYKSVSLMLGVDSARNASGAQTGVLDQATAGDMYWTWNSGYVFFKLEGSAPRSNGSSKSISYHIGGFGGEYKAQRSFQIGFGSSRAVIGPDKVPRLTLKTDLQEFFRTPTLIDVSTQYYMMSPGAGAKLYADNYADIISFESLQN
jgi:hypothetical protein